MADDVLVAADCGTATSWYARDLSMRPSQTGSLASLLLSMGGGMPYAIGAKTAQPHRPLVAMIGDGAMQMNGVNELITVSRYWRDWPHPRFVVLVLNNRQLAYLSRGTRGTAGAPPDPPSASLPDGPHAAGGRVCGPAGAPLAAAA